MSPLAVLLVLAVAAIALRRWLQPSSTESKGDEPRCCRRHPIGGTVFHQLWNIKRLYDYHTEVSLRYSTFRFIGFFVDFVYTVEPANVEYILKTNFVNYGKGELFKEITNDVLGEGISMVDGDKWRRQRKTASFNFSGRMIKNFATAVFKNNAIKLAAKISERADKSEIVAIDDLLVKSTTNSIFEILTGARLDCLSEQDVEGSRFIKAIDFALSLIVLRSFVLVWKIMRYFNLGYEGRLKESVKIVDDFLYRVIQDRIKDGCDKKDDFLSRLLESSNGDSGTINQKQVRDELLALILAGKDTTAGTLSWFIYMLCKHPSVQEKISLEIKEATKSSGNSGLHDVSFEDFAEDITEEAIDKMQYLHAAISETLRLHPIVPLEAKICISDDVLPDGYRVRKGDFVGFQPYAMGRMKSLWGEDAELFRPERWIDEHGRFRPESPYKFSVFQAGPRVCMGKDFAYRQMKIYAALLLRFFRFEMIDKYATISYKASITLAIDNGLHVYAYTN